MAKLDKTIKLNDERSNACEKNKGNQQQASGKTVNGESTQDESNQTLA